MNALLNGQFHTYADIESLPEGERAELVDGEIYYMSPPSRIHQKIVLKLAQAIANFIDSNHGSCEVYPAPFAVFLFGEEDDTNYFEPDISVICDTEKLTDKGCDGAPDFVIEVVSPSTASRDYLLKLTRYQAAGVKEYWVVNPEKKIVNVFGFASGTPNASDVYHFNETIPCRTLEGLMICLADLMNESGNLSL